MNRLFSLAEHCRRLHGLQGALERLGAAAAILLHPTDLFYYAGVALHGQLVVPAAGEPVFLVQINIERARAESWVTEIRPSLGWKSLGALLASMGVARGPIAVAEDVLPVQVYRRLQALAPEAEFVDLSAAILAQRAIKSAEEIERMRAAAELSARVMAHARQLLRGGMTEAEAAGQLFAYAKAHGLDGMMRSRAWNQGNLETGWIVAGPNSAAISGYWLTQVGTGMGPARPYGPSHRPLARGDLVCLDQGINLLGYHADEARTFVVGEPTAEQAERHAVAVAALDAAIAAVRPGAPVRDVYAAARSVVEAAGLGPYFMTRAFYDVEYLGHGFGIEIAEPPLVAPRSDEVLQPGMVIALEPKIIIPGWGGITVEDAVLVTADGCERLTSSPRELTILPC